MKRVLIFLLVFFLVSFVNAQDILESSEAKLEITQEGKIRSSGVSEVELLLYSYPRDSYFSEVISQTTSPNSFIDNGSYSFFWMNPDPQEFYSVNSMINAKLDLKKIDKKVKFPFKVPKEYSKYTKSSQLCDSDNLDIKKLANSLASGEDDTYKIIFNLAEWIKYNIEYTSEDKNETKVASDVLEIKKGACDEFSNLFMALCRSLNIPVKYITGYSYGTYGQEGFESHGWTEVWFPEYGWIPVDPTYSEIGWLDVSHVKLKSSVNPQSSSIKYTWKGDNLRIDTPEKNIKVVSKEKVNNFYLEGELEMEEGTTDIGSYNILWLKISNNNDFYVSTVSSVKTAPPLISENQKPVLIEPKSTEKIGWIIKYPSNLSEGYIYTYFNNVSTYFMSEKKAKSFVRKGENVLSLKDCEALLEGEKISKSGKSNVSIEISKPDSVKVGESYNITLNIRNKGSAPLENITVCIREKCIENYVGINDDFVETFELKADSVGLEKVIVIFKNLEIKPKVIEMEVIEKTFLDKLLDLLEEILIKFKLK